LLNYIDLVLQPRRGDIKASNVSSKQPASGLRAATDDKTHKFSAYHTVTKKVLQILDENPNAKVFITCYSMGGALVIVYAVMLMYIGESKISDKLEAVYTFGQPRVGDEGFKKYGNEKLGDRYFHIVYSHDFVPRIPFDSKCLKYKHFGKCIYYYSASYNAKVRTHESLLSSLLNLPTISNYVKALCKCKVLPLDT
jgi:predicted lipase